MKEAGEQREVSVILVNWNRRELLLECLRSLERQTLSGFEVVLVDNGSTDGSAASAMEEFAQSPHFCLRLVQNTENTGFCAGNNQGFAAARGRYVALLNNDAEAEPQWLEELMKGIQVAPDVGMSASKILVYEDPRRIDKAGHLIYPDGQNRGRGSGQIDRGQFDRMEEALWPDGCAAMYRREMLDEIGGFDEDLFAYGDDAELGLRARIAGWRCFYVPKAVVRHHRGATLGVLSAKRLMLIERNRILLAVKHFPLSLLWANFAYFALRLGAGIWAAARGKGEVGRFPGVRGKLTVAAALARGNWEAWRMVPRTLRKRRQLRPLRRLNSKQIRKLIQDYRIPLRELTEQAI